MAAVRDLDQMVAHLRPRRHPGRYVLTTVTGAGSSCNMVAAAHHDHLFGSAGRAVEEVRLLADLARRHRGGAAA